MQGDGNNGEELDQLECQVQKARRLVRQSGLKVEAIEACMHEIEKFYPEIKIISRPGAASEDASSIYGDDAVVKVR